MIEVARVGPDQAREVLDVIRASFGARVLVDPPSSATAETEASVRGVLAVHGGLVAVAENGSVGSVLFEARGDRLALRRLSVRPDDQGRGVARALVRRAEQEAAAAGFTRVEASARLDLPRTLRLWVNLGYVRTLDAPPLTTFVKTLPVQTVAADAQAMRDLGSRTAGLLRAGDVVILTGGLGAGKTTFTQGLGAGLGVRGDVTSPTFVIARVHPHPGGGPGLVHVDAYRVGGIEELDDLDLEASLEETVTVVEWGEEVAESLAPSRLEITITRSTTSNTLGSTQDPEYPEDPRTVRIVAAGPRWTDTPLRVLLDSEPATAAGAGPVGVPSTSCCSPSTPPPPASAWPCTTGSR